MARLSSVLRSVEGGYMHKCPGCGVMHFINTERYNHNGAKWTFDGNVDHPTFDPSINISWKDDEDGPQRCHYFVVSGQIRFCGDSTHKLAGQSLALPEIP